MSAKFPRGGSRTFFSQKSMTLKKAKAESALSLIYSCTVNGLIPLYTYFNHFSNPFLGSSATGKIFVYIYVEILSLTVQNFILFVLELAFAFRLHQRYTD